MSDSALAPAAPAAQPAAKPDTTPAPAAVASLLDNEIPDEPATVVETPAALEGEPAEKPEWARPDDPEAAAEWREERGVPAEPEDYELPVSDEAQNDATFKETLQGFTSLAHSLDLAQESAVKLYEFVERRGQEIMTARVDQDRAEAASAKQVLAEQWGDRASDNLKSVNALLKSLPGNLSKAIRDARSGNGLGSRLANEPAFLAMLSEYAALKAGASTAGIFDGEADARRATEIRRARSDDFEKYIRHGLDQELATIEARQAARAPAAEGERPGDRAREAEIRKILKANSAEYFQRGLDKELAQILNRRGTA